MSESELVLVLVKCGDWLLVKAKALEPIGEAVWWKAVERSGKHSPC